MENNSFKLMLQAMLDKVKSISNINKNIKSIESKLSKIKIQGILDSSKIKSELNTKLKSVKAKIKVDADTTQAVRKIEKLGQQKNKITVRPTVDNSQVTSGLKEAQQETKTLWEKFTSGVIGINLVRMSVQQVTQAVREAISTVKELDTIKTNIQMVSGANDSEVNAMMSSYNSMAKDLSSTTKEVGEAANEFLRMGESVASTNELIKSSQVLSKVGMIESSEAASYLISSLKGYQIAAQDSMDIVSKLTSVDLEAAVSAGGLAEALSKCSNIANNSGVSMDRLIGYTSTVGEVTQKSMSEVGNSFQSLLSRMNNIKIGKFIDDETGESLSDTEAVLNKLGIQLRDTEDTYRNFDDVLDDVGSRWKDFTKVEQNAISVAIAGTRQRENFEALMNNWGNALKYSETSANSAGSALERYGVYQDSVEAKTNELTAAMESLSTNAISEELFSGIIEATTGVVEFVDQFGILKGTLAGLVTMGISKMFVSMGTGIISAAKSTAQLTTAMAMFKNGRDVDNLRNIGEACKGLNDNQLKLILSTKNLETADRLLILEGMGVEEAEREAKLATLGFAAAENTATISTFSLKGAMSGLWTLIKANPIGTLVTVVSVATAIFSSFKQSQEEARQAAQEAAKEYKETASSIDEYTKKYNDLRTALINAKGNEEETYNIKKQLLELQTELNDKFGEEYGKINLVTDAYKDQTEAIKNYNEEAANKFLNENYDEINKAKKVMESKDTYQLSMPLSDKGNNKKVFEIAEKYKDKGIFLKQSQSMLLDNESLDVYTIYIEADPQTAYDTINEFETDVRELAKDLNNEHLFDGVVLSDTGSALKDTKDKLDKNKEIYEQGQMMTIAADTNLSKDYNEATSAVEKYNEAVLKSEDPYNDENVKAAWEDMQKLKKELLDDEEWAQYSNILDNVFSSAGDKAYEFYNLLQNDFSLKGLLGELDGLSDADLSSMANDGVDGDNYDAFDKLYEKAQKYGLEVQELIDLLIRLGVVHDGVSKKDVFNKFDGKVELTSEELKDNIDTLSPEDLKIAADLEINPQETKKNIESELDSLEEGGSVNLKLRPQIDSSELNKKGWDAGEGTATVYSSTYSNEDGTVAVNFTPIIADPETGEYLGVLSPEELQRYAEDVIAGTRKDDLNLQIGGEFTGKNAIEEASDAAEKIHELHERYYVDGDVLLSWDELIAKIKETKELREEESKKSFAEAWKSLDNTEDKDLKNTKKEVLELAKVGKLTEKTFNKVEGAKKWAESINEPIDSVIKKINSYVTSSEQLSAMSEGISSLTENLYNKTKNKDIKFIDADTLSKMPDELKECKKEWKEYENVMGDANSTAEDAKRVTDTLASAYVNNGNYLSNITKKNRDYYVAQMESVGITNAAAIADEALSYEKEILANKEDALAIAAEATKGEISDQSQALIDNAKMSDRAKAALVDLAAQETIFNSSSLSVEGKVEALNRLAKAYFKVSGAVKLVNAGVMGTDPRFTTSIEEQWQDFINSQNDVKVDTKAVNPSKSKTKDSSKKDKSKSTQQFDWISRALDRLSSKLDLVKAKYDNLFDNPKVKDSDSLLKQRNKNLEEQYKILKKTEKYQGKAEKKYQKKADSIKLDKSLKEDIEEGRINGDLKELIATYGEKKAKKIQEYQNWYVICHFA